MGLIKTGGSIELTPMLSYRALVGLAPPIGLGPGVIAKIQSRGIRESTTLRIAMHLTFGIVVAVLYRGLVPAWGLISWIFLFCGFQALSFYHFGTKWVRDNPRLHRDDVWRLNIYALIAAIMWGSAFGLLGTGGSTSQIVGLWSIVLCRIIFGLFLAPKAPMASTIFIGVTSFCASLQFALHGDYYFVVAASGIGVLLIMASLQSARAEILFEVANSIVQEKSETVSLLLREFEGHGADWLWQTDASLCISHLSPRFAFTLDGDIGSLEGQPLLKLMAGDAWEEDQYPPELLQLAGQLKQRGPFSDLIIPVTFKGAQQHWALSASPRYSEEGSFLGFRGVGSDVTAQREAANKIAHLARFDTLTGLPNRLLLTETLQNALKDADTLRRCCGFLMIDLDRFKAVNDSLGHLMGDRLLAQVAGRLQQIMSENELCGRLGGDEFAVVIKDASDTNYVATLSRRIIESLSQPYEVDQSGLFIGASVGSALGPVDGGTMELLMRSADLALYRSKGRGGNTHHSYQHKLPALAEDARLIDGIGDFGNGYSSLGQLRDGRFDAIKIDQSRVGGGLRRKKLKALP
jgi:diguanylate cyclase (GGDEF)-like protein